MKSAKFALALPVLLAAAVPATASAQAQMLCGPASAHVCVSALFTLSGGNTLNVFMFNGANSEGVNWQSVLTGFEISDLPTAGTWSLGGVYYNDYNGSTLASDGSTALASNGGWTFTTSVPGLVGITGNAGGSGPGGNGGISTCDGPTGGSGTKFRTCEGGGGTFGANDDWMKFSFTYSAGGLNAATLSGIDWGFKAQSVEGLSGNSLECEDAALGDKYCSASTPPGGGTPLETVTPEPATMSMLAFGLVGMAAAARRRRKK